MMLDGKVIVVAGASGGVGCAIARAASKEGAHILLGDDERAIEAFSAKIIAFGGKAAVVDNIAETAGAERIIEIALDHWGRIDAIVNAGNLLCRGAFPEPEPHDFERQVEKNLIGAFTLARAAASHFKTQESGAFIHITSSAALVGGPNVPGYCASMLGLVGLSRTLSFDMAKFNVRSNCIALGLAERGSQPRTDQVAPLAVFLASEAARGITGQIFGVEGDAITLFNQPRPMRLAHRSTGWTAETVARDLMPGWRSALVPHEIDADVRVGPAD